MPGVHGVHPARPGLQQHPREPPRCGAHVQRHPPGDGHPEPLQRRPQLRLPPEGSRGGVDHRRPRAHHERPARPHHPVHPHQPRPRSPPGRPPPQGAPGAKYSRSVTAFRRRAATASPPPRVRERGRPCYTLLRHGDLPPGQGSVAERSIASDCKSDGLTPYGGSNPPRPTTSTRSQAPPPRGGGVNHRPATPSSSSGAPEVSLRANRRSRWGYVSWSPQRSPSGPGGPHFHDQVRRPFDPP